MRTTALILCLAVITGCVAPDASRRAPEEPRLIPAREFTYMPPSAGGLPGSLPPLETAELLGPSEPGISPPYQIKPGDMLDIAIIAEDDSFRQVVVGPDGRISYLTVRDMMAAGKTFARLREDLTAALGRYYVEPQVELTGKTFSGNTITVLGMVNKPGRYQLRQKTRLLDALALAGGLRERLTDFGVVSEAADLSRAVLIRGGDVMPVDFHNLLCGEPREIIRNNALVKPGDSIYIPARQMAAE